MRARLLSGAGVVLLAGPVALAFFSGGYFDGPRAWAGLVAWLLVVLAVLCRSASAASHAGGRHRASEASLLLAGLDAALGDVGSDRRRRLPPRAAGHALRRRAAGGGAAAQDARARQGGGARGGRRRAAGDRLRALRAAPARGCCTSSARSAPRAGSSSRSRTGMRWGRSRRSASSSACGWPAMPRVPAPCACSPRRPPRLSAWACTSRSLAGRCSRASPGS